MITDPHRQDRCITADGAMAPNGRRPPFCLIAGRRPTFREQVVDEHHPMTDKTMIPNGHQLANKGMGLYLAVTADRHVLLYFIERADESTIAYPAAIKIHRLDHRDGFPEHYIVCYTGLSDLYTHKLAKLE
jgi:hypothetical protein